jgi:hypothetical protein
MIPQSARRAVTRDPAAVLTMVAVFAAAAFAVTAFAPDEAAAYSDKVKAPGFDGKYYPGLESLIPDREPGTIFERSCAFIHSSGNLLLHMSNGGFVGDFFGQFCSRPSAEFPPGSNNEYLFMAGLWVGAIDADGNPHVTTGAYDTEFLPDFNDLRDRIYTSFEGERGGGRYSTSGDATSADDDGDAVSAGDGRHINEDFRNGKDDDGDTRIDEDFEAISQQMYSAEYTDYGEVSTQFFNEHVPLFLRVQQRSFSWSSGGAENMIGLDYKVWNDGQRPLREIYLGFFVDSDVGPADSDEYPNMYLDDLVGFTEIDTTIIDNRPSTPAACRRTQVKLQLGFMRDLPDAEANIQDTGDVPGWFGGLFLGHSTDPLGVVAPVDVGIRTFVWFAQGGSIRDPENDFERYELLSRSSRTEDNKFIQDPPTSPRDYRYVLAVGPFAELLPDTFLTFQVAFVIGDGFDGPNGLKNNAVNAQRIFDGDFFNLDGDQQTGIDGREKCQFCGTSGPISTIDHNCDPTDQEIQCARGTCTWIDGDCANPAHTCTGMDAREGRVNWIGVSPPPAPPIIISTAGDIVGSEPEDEQCLGGAPPFANSNEVLVSWDNLVDKSVNPITGAKNFKGYRVWKAANWSRESESVPTESFQLIGDFSQTADSSCVKLRARDRDPGFPGDEHYVNWDFCLPSYEAFETFLDGLARPEDSMCPISVLDDRPRNDPLFAPELASQVFSKDIGACPLGYLIDRSVGYRQIDAGTCVERKLQVARYNPKLDIDGMVDSTDYQIADSTVATVCDTLWCKGYYRFNDRSVLPGYPYFYVVTAYSETIEEVLGESQFVELHTRPASSEESAVFPTSSASTNGAEAVTVVPNPYMGGAGWDLKPNPTDPTGTKVAFNHLPPVATVRIFTLSGDLVETLLPSEQNGGTTYWDLISRNGQDIVSGIYLYSVESPSGSTIGKLVVVR